MSAVTAESDKTAPTIPVDRARVLVKKWNIYASRYTAREPAGYWLRHCIDALQAEIDRVVPTADRAK